jgi:ribosomal protein S18 acetylase RimI-like enzyme
MAIHVRRARAEDADFLAWVMLAASRGHLPRGIWDLRIGADDAGCLDYLRRLALAEPRSLCHYQAFRIAVVDGNAAAALCAFDSRVTGWAIAAEAMAHVQRDLGWSEAQAATSDQRMSPLWACFLPDVGADWAIENVATRPQYRRLGLTSRLLDDALHEAIERGCQLAQITTFIGNTGAQSVYERAGFRLAEEKRCPQLESLLKVPGFARFLRAL